MERESNVKPVIILGIDDQTIGHDAMEAMLTEHGNDLTYLRCSDLKEADRIMAQHKKIQNPVRAIIADMQLHDPFLSHTHSRYGPYRSVYDFITDKRGEDERLVFGIHTSNNPDSNPQLRILMKLGAHHFPRGADFFQRLKTFVVQARSTSK